MKEDHTTCIVKIASTPQGADHPLPFFLALRRQVEIIWTNKLPPSSPLG